MKRVSCYLRLFIIPVLLVNCMAPAPHQRPGVAPRRIISLAPSITEILFALGAGDRLVGVTSFCRYPPAAQAKPCVGGFSDINYEAILNLKPDMLLVLPSHAEAVKKFEQLGLAYTVIPQRSLADIRQSILDIGDIVGLSEAADSMAAAFDRSIKPATIPPRPAGKPAVLIVVSRTPGTVKNIFVAGRNTSFYNDLIELAGGTNAAPESASDYPMLSAESVLYLNPDIIVEIYSPDSSLAAGGAQLKHDWQALPGLNALKKDRIFMVVANYAVIPGPRIVQLLEDLRRFISQR